MSRGAKTCLFVEEAAEARGLIRRNQETLGLIGDDADIPPRCHDHGIDRSGRALHPCLPRPVSTEGIQFRSFQLTMIV